MWHLFKGIFILQAFVLCSLFKLTDWMCLVINTVVVKQAWMSWLNDSSSQGQSTQILPLRFLDQSLKQNRTWNLQCPYSPNVPVTPEPVIPTVSQPPPSTTGSEAHQDPVVPTPSVYCSLHQMNVELPAGPISEVVLKGGCLPFTKIYRRHTDTLLMSFFFFFFACLHVVGPAHVNAQTLFSCSSPGVSKS